MDYHENIDFIDSNALHHDYIFLLMIYTHENIDFIDSNALHHDCIVLLMIYTH